MKRLTDILLIALVALSPLFSPQPVAASPAPVLAPQQRGGGAGRRGGGDEGDDADDEDDSDGLKEYSEVITEDAVTKPGMFAVHEVDGDLFFEIPTVELGKEMLLIQRTIESTLQEPGSFSFGKPLALSFCFNVLVSFLAAWMAVTFLDEGADATKAGLFVGLIGFLAFSVSNTWGPIWKSEPWCVWGKEIFDGVVYGAAMAGVFVWLGPWGAA